MNRQPEALQHGQQRLKGGWNADCPDKHDQDDGKHDASEARKSVNLGEIEDKRGSAKGKEGERLMQVCYGRVACLEISDLVL